MSFAYVLMCFVLWWWKNKLNWIELKVTPVQCLYTCSMSIMLLLWVFLATFCESFCPCLWKACYYWFKCMSQEEDITIMGIHFFWHFLFVTYVTHRLQIITKMKVSTPNPEHQMLKMLHHSPYHVTLASLVFKICTNCELIRLWSQNSETCRQIYFLYHKSCIQFR